MVHFLMLFGAMGENMISAGARFGGDVVSRTRAAFFLDSSCLYNLSWVLVVALPVFQCHVWPVEDWA